MGIIAKELCKGKSFVNFIQFCLQSDSARPFHKDKHSE